MASMYPELVFSRVSPRTFRKSILRFLFSTLVLFGLSVTAFGQNRPALTALSRQNAAQQIQALMDDKDARTPAQQKIDSQLIYAARERATGRILSATPRLRHSLAVRAGGLTDVNVRGIVSADLLAAIRAAGGIVIGSYPADKAVVAQLPLASIETIAARKDVFFIGPPSQATSNSGAVDSQGDAAHLATLVRTNFGADGSGVKVGVLSDSIDDSSNSLANAIASGDLDSLNTYVLNGQAGVGEGEGLAMCEIVHDLAPKSILYFATGFGGEFEMATNIRSMATSGCKVIIDDVTFNDESPFQDGPVAQAVNDVSAQGVLYFSSARNSGNKDSDISCTWEGDFVDGGSWGGTNRSGRLLAFAPGVTENAFLPGGLGLHRADLFWADPAGAATDDYDLYMLDSSGNVVFAANTTQNGTQDPYEHINDTNNFGTGYFLVVTLHSGVGRFIHLDAGRSHLSVSTGGCVRGHNASGAANAFSVAAAPAAAHFVLTNSPTGPYPGAFSSTNGVETFSSDGPRRIFFNPDGTAITPGNFSSTGGLVLQKPDFTAADGVITTLPGDSGLNPFFGTSAAAPHAGAIAALLLSYRPDLTPAQIRTALTASAIDIGAPGYDRDSGAGIIMADRAIAYINPTINILLPAEGQVYSNTNAPQISGTSGDNDGTVNVIRVAVSRNSDGAWYDFLTGSWTTTPFNFDHNVLIASGTTSWSAHLPGLPNGGYTVQVQAVDQFSDASPWATKAFSINIAPPVVAFDPLVNTQTVFDFSSLGGTINKPGTVVFRIQQYDASGNNDLYWNGTAWIADGNSPSVYLAASVSSGRWAPSPGVHLPTRAQTRPGPYFLRAVGTDFANNSGTTEILVSRSSPDTTPPVVTLNNLHNGDVLTNAFLPGLSGSALDNESGISLVNVYLNQFSDSGVLYWNGSAWSSNPAVLTAGYNPQTVVWQINDPLPSGANLPNAGYQVQIIAYNQEVPSGNTTLSVNFSVDYHPVFVFTAGSFQDADQFNNDFNWNNPANWNVGSVPTEDARVIINNFAVDNTSLGSLKIYGLDMSGGQLTTAGMLIKKLNLSGGFLSGGAITLATNGLCNWTGGTIGGVFSVPKGAFLNLNGSVPMVFYQNSTVNLDGTTVWTGAGDFDGGYGVVIENSGVFSIQGTGQFGNNTGSAPVPTFVNTGTLVKTNSSGTATISAMNGGWNFSNDNIFDIESGALSVQTQFNFDSNAILSGAGVLTVDGGTTTVTGTNTLRAGVTFQLNGGTLQGQNVFAGPGTFEWTGGTIFSTNTILTNANFLITGTAAKVLNQGWITNNGSCVWEGGGPLDVYYNSAFWNNGTFLAESNAVYYNISGSAPLPLFVNNGTFIVTNNVGTVDFDSANSGTAFNNNGTVKVQTGSLTLGGGGVSLNSTFNVAVGAQLVLNGGQHFFGPGLNFTGGGLTRLIGGVTDIEGTNTLTGGSTFETAGGLAIGTNWFAGTGNFNWSGGILSEAFNLQTNIAFNIFGADDKLLSQCYVTVAGNSSLTGSGRVLTTYNSAIINNGNFGVQTDSTFYNISGGAPQPRFINNGTFTKTNSAGSTVFNSNNSGTAFDNNGIVKVQSGNLVLGGGGNELNDQFYAVAGSWIDYTSGFFSFDGATLFGGGGTNRASGGSFTFNNTISTLSGGYFEVTSTALVVGTNNFAGSGTFNWDGGTIGATLNLQPNIAFTVFGASDKILSHGGYLTLGGNSTWLDAGSILTSYSSEIINNGSFTVQNDSTFNNVTGAAPQPRFINNGTFTKTNSTGTTSFRTENSGTAFDNNGIVNVRGGNLVLGGGGNALNEQFNANASSFIDFNSGAFVFDGNSQFGGAGTNRASNAALTFDNIVSTMAGGYFELGGASFIYGTNTFAGPGTFDWIGGTVSGVLNLPSSLSTKIYSSDSKRLIQGIINTAGNIVWSDAGDVIMTYASAVTNKGTFTSQNGASFINISGGAPSPAFVNNGSFIKTSAAVTNFFSPQNGGVAFNNNGAINVQAGTLDLGGGGISANGTFTAGSGAHIDLSSGAFIANGTLVVQGAGLTRINGASVIINGGATTLTGTLEMASGTVLGNSVLSGPGTFNWTGGTMTANLSLLSNISLNISGASDKTFGNSAALATAGNAILTGTGNIYLAYGSTINNSGTFEVQNDSQFFNYTGGSPQPLFINSGTFRKIASSGTTLFTAANSGVLFTNSGILDLRSGIVAFDPGNSTSPTATLKIALGGTNSATQFGMETFATPAAFDGALAVSLANGFVPTNGQTFVIANYPSATGQFSAKQLPALSFNQTWSVNYGSTALTLSVVPQATLSGGKLLSNGHFQISLSGPVSSSAVLMASTNLTTWSPIITNAPFNGTNLFDDPQANQFTKRFYRAAIQP